MVLFIKSFSKYYVKSSDGKIIFIRQTNGFTEIIFFCISLLLEALFKFLIYTTLVIFEPWIKEKIFR